MQTRCSRQLEWDAAHRVMRHESKCSTLHGHRYVAVVTCAGELDAVGRVVDFGLVKHLVGAWIDRNLDHTTIVNKDDANLRAWCESEAERLGKREPFIVDGEPTAENLAALLLRKSRELLEVHGIEVVSVCVYETPNCSAEASL